MSNCPVVRSTTGGSHFTFRKPWHREVFTYMHPTIKPEPFGTFAEVQFPTSQGWWNLLHCRKYWGHVSRVRRIEKRKKR